MIIFAADRFGAYSGVEIAAFVASLVSLKGKNVILTGLYESSSALFSVDETTTVKGISRLILKFKNSGVTQADIRDNLQLTKIQGLSCLNADERLKNHKTEAGRIGAKLLFNDVLGECDYLFLSTLGANEDTVDYYARNADEVIKLKAARVRKEALSGDEGEIFCLNGTFADSKIGFPWFLTEYAKCGKRKNKLSSKKNLYEIPLNACVCDYINASKLDEYFLKSEFLSRGEEDYEFVGACLELAERVMDCGTE
ncbi:MAG: hypothetical protein K6B75_00840 [Lachnospiraceae bacterium]|nr:hypothetical protein [Lachnospiraceae bacterium]